MLTAIFLGVLFSVVRGRLRCVLIDATSVQDHISSASQLSAGFGSCGLGHGVGEQDRNTMTTELEVTASNDMEVFSLTRHVEQFNE